MTLAEKVHELVARPRDDASDRVLLAAGTYPVTPEDASLTTFELECREWGLFVGIACGIARGEDPFECDQDVVDRALVAARDAWRRWGNSEIFTTQAFDNDRSRAKGGGA